MGALLKKGEGDGVNGAQVGGNVLADHAVAPGGPLHEYTVFVGQGHGQAVDLQLTDHVEIGVVREVPGAPAPLLQTVEIEGIGQAQHGTAVLHLGKGCRRSGPGALGRGVRRLELGVFIFQFPQLADQQVVLVVRDDRVVEDVVPVVVEVKLLLELLGASFYGGLGHVGPISSAMR